MSVFSTPRCPYCSEWPVSYGAFPGGDPRDFDPDIECSTASERELHRRACVAADTFGIVNHRSLSGWYGNAHVLASQFGLGAYRYECCAGAA